LVDPNEREPIRPRQASPRTRGFLFADLRGYTDFVEAHGDRAATELLTAYRAIVRRVVAEYDGAEIRTEGDSFYVVFESASGAVRCGIEIVGAAAEASTSDPALPIRVGVGVHAGESAEDSEGYVGLAVNIAARVCAQATAGEVLVTETVRSLTGGSEDLRFTLRGRRKLKGVSEPIALYRVDAGRRTRELEQGVVATRRRGRLAVAAAAGLVVVAALGIAGGRLLDRPGAPSDEPIVDASKGSAEASPATLPSASARSLPLSDGLAPHVTTPPGLYTSTGFKPSTTFYLGTGWEATADQPDYLELRRQTAVRGQADGFLSFSRLRLAFTGPCESSATQLVSGGPEAVMHWLQTRKDLLVSDPVPIDAGGVSGLRMDIKTNPQPPSCPDLGAGTEPGYYLFRTGSSPFFLRPGERAQLSALDVAGQTVLMVVEQTLAPR